MSIGPCTTDTPTHGVVVFEPDVFRTLYPEFATVTTDALSWNFELATLIVNNSCASRVSNATVREKLLNVLVAHLTALAQGVSGQSPQGIVGRVDSATEGSVSVSAAYASQVGSNMAYFTQTKYGALFWQLTAPFRTMLYIPPPGCCGPIAGGGGNGYNNLPGY